MFRSLAVRNYRLFFLGNLASSLGIWMQRIAQSWVVLILSGGSGVALGVATFLQFFPTLLLSIPAGVLSDRFGKIPVLLVTQVLIGATSLTMAVLDGLDQLTLPLVYTLTAALGVAAAADAPVRQSFVTELVGHDDVANAVGLNSAGFNLSRLVGPALAGLVIAHLATWTLFAGHAVAAALVVVLLVRIDRAQLVPGHRIHTIRGQVDAGLRYLWRTPVLVVLCVAASLTSLVGLNSLQVLLPLVATQTFDAGPVGFGLLTSALAVGSLVGALLASRTTGMPRLRWLLLTLLGFGLSQMIASAMPTYAAFAVALTVSGLLFMPFVVSVNTSVQLRASDEMRSRVMAVYMMFFLGGGSVGGPAFGALAEAVGPATTIGLAGAFSVVVACCCALALTYALGLRRFPFRTPDSRNTDFTRSARRNTSPPADLSLVLNTTPNARE